MILMTQFQEKMRSRIVSVRYGTQHQLYVHAIGVAPIMQVTHMYNKNSNIHGRSSNVIK